MKNKFYCVRLLQLMLLTVCCGALAFADVTIKTRQTASGQTSESITQIKGKRQRSDNGYGYITVEQCDLRRSIQLMPTAQTYKIEMYDATDAATATTRTSADRSETVTTIKKGGVVTTTITNKDTGERKPMFGYTARRIITTMETVTSADSCNPNRKNRVETDQWVIDAEFYLNCRYPNGYEYKPEADSNGCRDRYETKQIGRAKSGYPLWQKTVMFDETGRETYSYTSEVVELSKAVLNPELFDVPSGYREATDFSGAATAAAGSSSTSGTSRSGSMPKIAGIEEDAADGDASGGSSPIKNLSGKPSAVSTSVGAKKPGIVRLGLATVKTGSIGEGMNAAELGAAIGNTLAEYLKAPNLELVPLTAKLPAAVDSEASQKECDFVIYAVVSHKKGGGGGLFGKAFGSIAGSALSRAGYGGTAGAIAGQAASTAVYTAASMSANVKSKDEITLEYKLLPAGSQTPAVANTVKAKAKSDGQDIISQLVEQAATVIVGRAAKQ